MAFPSSQPASTGSYSQGCLSAGPSTDTHVWGDTLVGEGGQNYRAQKGNPKDRLYLGLPKSKMWQKCSSIKSLIVPRLSGSPSCLICACARHLDSRPFAGARVVREHPFNTKPREGDLLRGSLGQLLAELGGGCRSPVPQCCGTSKPYPHPSES